MTLIINDAKIWVFTTRADAEHRASCLMDSEQTYSDPDEMWTFEVVEYEDGYAIKAYDASGEFAGWFQNPNL